MGLQNFEIHFDNPSATYFGGQTLSGRLDITLDTPKKVRGKICSVCYRHNFTEQT